MSVEATVVLNLRDGKFIRELQQEVTQRALRVAEYIAVRMRINVSRPGPPGPPGDWPRIDSGTMAASIHAQADGKGGATVVVGVDYAHEVDVIRPFIQRTFKEEIEAARMILRGKK